jgi:HAD superfamily hydrolase (TIGR01549 family)
MSSHTSTDTGRPDTDDERALLFDMDGVILEGHGTDAIVHDHALDDALDERGLSVDAETRGLLEGYEYDTDFAVGCERLGVDPIELFELREQYGARRAIDRLAAGSRELYADVDVLPELAERYELGLISNNYDSVVEFVVDHHGIDVFSHVRGRDTGVRGFYRRKPDPHYLLEAVGTLGATDGLYVGDRATDVVAATRAGLDAVFVRRSHNSDVPLPNDAVAEIESLTELANRTDGAVNIAQRAIRRVNELEEQLDERRNRDQNLVEQIRDLERELNEHRENTRLLKAINRASSSQKGHRVAILVQYLYNKAKRHGREDGGQPAATADINDYEAALGGDVEHTYFYRDAKAAVDMVGDTDVLTFRKEAPGARKNSRLILDLTEGNLPSAIGVHEIDKT